MIADEAAELAVVLLLVFDDMVQDGDAGLVAQLFELLRVAGDVAALVDFKTAEGNAGSANALGESVGGAGGLAVVVGHRSPSSRIRLVQSTAW